MNASWQTGEYKIDSAPSSSHVSLDATHNQIDHHTSAIRAKITKMHFKKIILAAAAASVASVKGAEIEFWTGPNCSGDAAYRNVYDNTCAPTGGFQSFRITSGGGGGQYITSYSQNACIGTHYTCVNAGDVGPCLNSYGADYSGSNAISSGTGCGIS